MWSKNCKPCSDSTLSSTPSIDSKECKARAVSKNCKPWSDSTLGSTFSIDSREHEARALIKNCKPWSDSTLSSTSSIDSREYKARALGNDEAVREQVLNIFRPYENKTINWNEVNDSEYKYEDGHTFDLENTIMPRSEDMTRSVPSWSSMYDRTIREQQIWKLDGNLDELEETAEEQKDNSTDVYKTFLDRHRQKCDEQEEKIITLQPIQKENAPEQYFYCDPKRKYRNILRENNESSQNAFLRSCFKNRSDYLIHPNLFPTREGQVYYQNFKRYRKYSGQYSNKLYGHLRKKFNTDTENTKNDGSNEHDRRNEFDFFNAINLNLLEPSTKVKVLHLLCTSLQKQYHLNVVYLEEAKLCTMHGVALLLAIDLEKVDKLFMYNLFDKDFDIYEEYFDDDVIKNPTENALDLLRSYEFHVYEKNLQDQDQKNKSHKNYETLVMLSSSIEITNNETYNENSLTLEAANFDKKCFRTKKQDFKFDESPQDLYYSIRNAMGKSGNSLKFLKRLNEVPSLISNNKEVDLIMYKYCLTMFCNLKVLSCNYQYLTDETGKILETISNHSVLECLQLFIEPLENSISLEDELKVNIIPNETWVQCKSNCPGLEVHFVITGLLFTIAEKFITKEIPLSSLHISSGALIPKTGQNNELLPLLNILMKNFTESLKVLSITKMWKCNTNENLDMFLSKSIKNLKVLHTLEYTGDLNDLDNVVNNICKVKHARLKRITLKINNFSQHAVNQVYTQYQTIFQSDKVEFTLVSLNI